MVVPFFGVYDTLRQSSGTSKVKVPFLTHLHHLTGYLAFTDLIKNQSIGVPQGVLHTLVWIFEYVTD